jgi:hypothetical protein
VSSAQFERESVDDDASECSSCKLISAQVLFLDLDRAHLSSFKHTFLYKKSMMPLPRSLLVPTVTMPASNPASLDLLTWRKQGAPHLHILRWHWAWACSCSRLFSRFSVSFGAKHPMAMRALVLVAQSQVLTVSKIFNNRLLPRGSDAPTRRFAAMDWSPRRCCALQCPAGCSFFIVLIC